MTRIDEAIRQTLSAEDAKALERYGSDSSLVQQVLEAFQGRTAMLNVLVWVVALALFVASVYSGWRFFETTDVPRMLRWGGATLLAVISLISAKLWFWQELKSNAVIREVKRLELQVARLAAR